VSQSRAFALDLLSGVVSSVGTGTEVVGVTVLKASLEYPVRHS